MADEAPTQVPAPTSVPAMADEPPSHVPAPTSVPASADESPSQVPAPTSVPAMADSGPAPAELAVAASQPHPASSAGSTSGHSPSDRGTLVTSQVSRVPGTPALRPLTFADSARNPYRRAPSTGAQASPSTYAASSASSTASCNMDQERHRECSPGQIQCPYAVYACAYKGTSEQIEEHCHTASPQHAAMTVARDKALSDKLDALQRSASVQEQAVARLQEGMAAQLYEVQCLEETPPTTPTALGPGALLADRRFLAAMKSTVSEKVDALVAATMSDAHISTKACQTRVKETEDELDLLRQELQDYITPHDQLRQSITWVDERVNDIDQSLLSVETSSCDGTITFKINDFARCHEDARNSIRTSLYSPIFSANRHGYKARLRVYPNGDSTGKGSHVSVLFCIMKGEFDSLLNWPFRAKVTFAVLDQGSPPHDRIELFIPDPQSSSFQRPVNDMNIASGCPKMVSHSELYDKQSSYLRDGCLYIKASVVERVAADVTDYTASGVTMQQAHAVSSPADTPTNEPEHLENAQGSSHPMAASPAMKAETSGAVSRNTEEEEPAAENIPDDCKPKDKQGF